MSQQLNWHLTHPMLALFFCGEKHAGFLHISCWLHFYLGSFSYTTRAGFIFIWGVSLTHPVFTLFFSGEFLLHFPCWHFKKNQKIWGVPLTHPMLASFLCGEFLLTHSVLASSFLFIWGVSLTHPTLALFLPEVFLIHILCRLHFYLGSFSYTSCAGFIFLWGVSLTHRMIALFFCGKFLLHFSC